MQSRTPRTIAVIIPVYRAHYLAECLASVFAQTLPPTQVIVIDDGSPDRSEIDCAVARYRYRDQLTFLHQENLGAGAARNRGLRHASADLIAFLDADDLWCPELLERQVHALSQDHGPALAYANGRLIGDGPLRGMLFMDTAPSTGEPTLEALLSQRCTVLTSSVVVERTALVAAGLFDEALRRGQDFDMWVRLAAAGARFMYTTEPLVYRRIHTMNLSGDRLTELERAAGVYARLRAKIRFGPAAARALDAQLRLLHADIHAERGKRDLAAGAVVDAAAHFRQAAGAGAGWKVRFVNLALRVAPRATRHAYALKTRRGAAPEIA
jgi:glycosyltransferase involved in cell wall biosynthesis